MTKKSFISIGAVVVAGLVVVSTWLTGAFAGDSDPVSAAPAVSEGSGSPSGYSDEFLVKALHPLFPARLAAVRRARSVGELEGVKAAPNRVAVDPARGGEVAEARPAPARIFAVVGVGFPVLAYSFLAALWMVRLWRDVYRRFSHLAPGSWPA